MRIQDFNKFNEKKKGNRYNENRKARIENRRLEKNIAFFKINNICDINNFLGLNHYIKIICVIWVYLVLTVLASGQNVAFCKAEKVSESSAMRGALNEEGWNNATKYGGFVSASNVGSKPLEDTSFSVLHDDENLYIGIECHEMNMKKLLAKCVANNDPNLYKDDSVEIFIDPTHNHKDYVQFIINSRGNVYSKNWNAACEVKTALGENAWTVTVKLPLAGFGINFDNKLLFGFNVCRNQYAAGIQDLSFWADTGGCFYHRPHKFGHLVFEEKLCLRETLIPFYQNEYAKKHQKILAGLSRQTMRDSKNELERFVLYYNKMLETWRKQDKVSLSELRSIYEKLEAMSAQLDDLQSKIECPQADLWLD